MEQEMTLDEIYEHADIVSKTVWHTFDNYKFGLNLDQPHAEDCPGCIIDAEVKKLTVKLRHLAPVEKLTAELAEEKEKRELLELDKKRAFDKAGLINEGLVSDLVVILMKSNNILDNELKEIKQEINAIARKL